MADVLRMPDLARAAPTVLAGNDRLYRPVRWVHAAEVADVARLLKGGELVLTTGIALPSDADGLAAYATELAEVGATGLVVELGRRWETAPSALVHTCERTGLPLITLRREASFAAVIQAVAERIVDAQLNELQAVERIHEEFSRLSDVGAGDEEIIGAVARMSGLPVALESAHHHLLAVEAADHDSRVLLDRWEERSRSVAVPGRTGYEDSLGWLVTVVGAHGHDWGRLVLMCPQPPAHRHVVLVERAASTLALHRLLARDRESLERQTHRTLLAALHGLVDEGSDLPQRCAAAGVPVEGRALAGVVVLPRAGHAPAVGSAASAPQRVRDLAETAAAAARRTGLDALVGVIDDAGVECLLSLVPRQDAVAATDRFAREIQRSADGRADAAPMVVAAGCVVDRVADARRSLLEARQVAEAAVRQTQITTCHRLHDVHLRGLLWLLDGDQRLTAFADRELAALRSHDDANGTRLVDTLGHLLDNRGNKAAAASAAHISRPAFYERLDRIERILGVDLTDAETLTSLHVALLISRR